MALSAFVMVVAAVFTFVLARLLPGDPASHLLSGMAATPQGIAQMRHAMGLDASIPTQLGRYLLGLLHGDWGRSFVTQEPVLDALRERLPASLTLTIGGFLLTVLLGLPLAISAALRPGGAADRFCRVLTSASGSLPSFFIGLALIYVFYFRLNWLPEPSGQLDPFALPPPARTGFVVLDALLARDWASAWDAFKRVVLPAVTMALFGLAPLVRITRSALLQTLASEHVRCARVLGVSPHTILLHYALKPAAAPIITASGMVFSYLLGANVAVEKVFAWPGIGAYALDALSASDYAPLQGFILCVAIMFALLNLAVDLLVSALDPRAEGARSP